jgi:PST family polysaccharide transporter
VRQTAKVPTPNLAESAFSGSSWTLVQVVLNKGAAAVATFFLGFLLSPVDFGIAWFANSVGQLLLVFPVVAISDVLLAHSGNFARLKGSARVLATRAAISQAGVCIMIGAVLSQIYPSKVGLLLAMVVVAMRPIADSIAIVPMSALRIGLRYGTLAKVDCAVAFIASVCSVMMAWFGMGAMAIVLPPIAAIAVRGVIYGRLERTVGPSVVVPRIVPILRSRFLLAALGGYAAGLIFMLEMIVLALCTSTSSLGLYAFAFGLATQVNSALSFQAAGALQPIIAKLEGDRERQVSAALRSVRLLAAIMVPVLLVQCAVGAPILHAIWGGKWDSAAVLFGAISLVQAVYICQWPAAFVLKAQGRFRAYLKSQCINTLIAAPVCIAAIRWFPVPAHFLEKFTGLGVSQEALAPLAVVSASFALACVFSPLLLWLAVRPGKIRVVTVLDVIWRPWLTAIPVAVVVGVAARAIERLEMVRVSGTVALLALAMLGSAVGVIITVGVTGTTRADAAKGLRYLQGRLLQLLPRRA